MFNQFIKAIKYGPEFSAGLIMAGNQDVVIIDDVALANYNKIKPGNAELGLELEQYIRGNNDKHLIFVSSDECLGIFCYSTLRTIYCEGTLDELEKLGSDKDELDKLGNAKIELTQKLDALLSINKAQEDVSVPLYNKTNFIEDTYSGDLLPALTKYFNFRYIRDVLGYKGVSLSSSYKGWSICIDSGRIPLMEFEYEALLVISKEGTLELVDGAIASYFEGEEALLIPPRLVLERLSDFEPYVFLLFEDRSWIDRNI